MYVCVYSLLLIAHTLYTRDIFTCTICAHNMACMYMYIHTYEIQMHVLYSRGYNNVCKIYIYICMYMYIYIYICRRINVL